MRRNNYVILMLLFIVPVTLSAQTIKFSDFEREDSRDINFEIIGKMNNKILVYKDIKWKHKINIFDNDMNTLETVSLDFIPEKTYNIDFVVYPDFFYMIYQYQKKSILHCMGVKMDGNAKMIGEPVELDTTQIPWMSDNKIYSTITSEDKQKIMIFKLQSRNQKYAISTVLFDSQLKLISRGRQVQEYDERREKYDNFSLANDGNFLFTFDKQSGNRDNSNILKLGIKSPKQDTFTYLNIDLERKYIDEVKLKIDNLNNNYIINTFFYKKNRGSIEGLFTFIWNNEKGKAQGFEFTEFYDSLRAEAKQGGLLRIAFDNFFIREVVVKRDGGFILTAEDFSSETRGFNNNSWNRYNYLYNPSYLSSGSYYYNPYGYYRPLSSYNTQSTMYYYENIVILSVDKNGKAEWSKVIQKEQFDNNDDNFMSFSTMRSKGEIHFLFNTNTKNQIIADQSIAPDGTIKRYPTLKTQAKGYEFMPRHSKQVGANQLIIPCTYRNNICFAKVDF